VRRRSLRLPFVKAGVALVGRLPPALAAWAGERLGAALYRFATHSRHRVLFQLRLAFPERSDAELRTIARSSFRLMGRGALSLPSLRRRGVESLLARFELEGEQHLAEALAAGKGAIVVTYHFGPFEAAGAWLAHRHGGVAVGRDVGTLDAAQVLVDIRRDLGLTTIERGDARAIVRALRGNLPVAIVADHDVRNVNGVFVPFFGHLAHTAIGPAALAVRTGAPIVPVFVDWIGRTRYRARVGEALRPRDDLSRHEVVHELTYRFTKIGEQNIRAQPDHWLWLHKRWETRPEQRPEQPVWRPAAGPDSVVPS
jgi:KDO2-lipid IV(A) lauroyltransferase